MFSKKPELSKLFELKDIEGREAAVMPPRLEVSSRALEEHGQKDVGHAVHLIDCVSRSL